VFFLPTTYSQTHTDARIKAIKNGARGATMCDITEDALCTGAILGDYEECDRLGRKLGAIMDQTTEMRMTTPAGTDIKGIIKGRPVQYETGLFRNKGEFAAFPNSEINISPVEGSAEGVVVADFRVMSVGVTRTAPITLRVKGGAVCGIEGGPGADDLMNILGGFKDPTAFNLAEFAIGLNPCARMYATNLEDLGKLWGAPIVE
jgi:leucyl aminopeptidase (aminopeptidase T)